MTFSLLPNELKLLLADELQLNDVIALARTSRASNKALTIYLFGRAKGLSTRDGKPAFLLAAGRGNLFAVRQFIEVGVSVDIRDWDGRTALHICAYHGHSSVAQLLIDKGAQVSITDKNGFSPLRDAIVSRNSTDSMVRLLLHSGANTSAGHHGWGTALHTAAFYGTTSVAKILLGHGVDGSRIDQSGCTALHVATHRECAAIVRLLLGEGLAVDARDFSGETPLHFAARSGAAETVAALLQSGANVRATDDNGDTPLHFAIKFRGAQTTDDHIVRLGEFMPDNLRRVHRNAAALAVDRLSGQRMNGIDLASLSIPWYDGLNRNDSIIEQLLDAGADISATNNRNCSPLFFAVLRTRYWPAQTIAPAPGGVGFVML